MFLPSEPTLFSCFYVCSPAGMSSRVPTTSSSAPTTCCLRPLKDIHNFDGVHGDWLKHATAALVVHHHHEKITAGDLLNHKRPANVSTDRQKKQKHEEARRKRKLRVTLASNQGMTSISMCFTGLMFTFFSEREGALMSQDACQEDGISTSPRVNKWTDADRLTETDTYTKYTHLCLQLFIIF